MRSLTGRLVATAVLLVAMVSLLVVGLTTFAMRSYLGARLDEQVLLTRVAPPGVLPVRPPDSETAGGDVDDDHKNYGIPGTLSAELPESGTTGGRGWVLKAGDEDDLGTDLTTADLATLDGIPVDRRAHVVHLSEGEYHVVARTAVDPTGSRTRLFTGLPSSDITRTLVSLLTWGLALTVAGVALAAGVALGGAGLAGSLRESPQPAITVTRARKRARSIVMRAPRYTRRRGAFGALDRAHSTTAAPARRP